MIGLTKKLNPSLNDSPLLLKLPLMFSSHFYLFQALTAAKTSVQSPGESDNPYKVLVEKYETLRELQLKQLQHRNKQHHHQQHHSCHLKTEPEPSSTSLLSLQEELQMSGEFNLSSLPQDQSQSKNQPPQVTSRRKPFPGACTPTADFSETETMSSGFSDETSNKATQTESQRPGSFLCSIADGDDCKFSIYDDCSNFRSRFQQTPEYRHLFSEIFSVLKRAAVAKAEGEALPLANKDSDARDSAASTPKADDQLDQLSVSMYTCTTEDAPSEFTADETGSVISSVMSEPAFRVNTPVLAGRSGEAKENNDVNLQSTSGLRPLQHNSRRQPLEYLSVQVLRRKAASNQKRSRSKRSTNNENTPTPDVVPTCNPSIVAGSSAGGGQKGSKKYRYISRAEIMSDGTVWNGQQHHRRRQRHRHHPHNSSNSSTGLDDSRNSADSGGVDGFGKPGTASEEVAKLKRLEMSYAEALKMPSGKAKSRHRRRHQQQQQQ